TTIMASMKAAVIASPPQAARENASRMARAMMANATPFRNAFAKWSETTLCKANRAGRIRKAPSTFGSLKGPRPRPSWGSRAWPVYVEGESVVPAGNEIEIARNGRNGRDHRAEDEAAAKHVEARERIFRH